MTKEQAARAKAQWLSGCLEFGWQKSDLDGLSEVWDKFKDENGNLRPAAPSTSGVNVLLEALEDIDPRKSDGADQEWYKYYVSQVQGEGKESFVHSAACYLAAMLAQQELYEKIMAILAQYKAQSGEPGIQQEEIAKEMLTGIMGKSVYGTKLRFILDEYHITKKP